MPHSIADQGHHPPQGTRCLAAPDGYWTPGVIQRVNEDGTYTIEFDEKQMSFMPYWYGVTADQVSINDEALWPNVFPRVIARPVGMSQVDFANILWQVGYQFEDAQLNDFWMTQCKELFGIENADSVLDQQQGYKLLRRAGCSAKQLALAERDYAVYYKLYWNLTRMGGRQPDEIARPVTLDDAFRAMGIRNPSLDTGSQARIKAFQQENHVELPLELQRLLCCPGISRAVAGSHPNNPRLVFPDERGMLFCCNPPLTNGSADYALTIVEPHQGDHRWAAVFNRGDQDAQVYVMWDFVEWRLSAPTLGMFFWDLAQTGLIWYQNTGFQGGKAIEKTDIGVCPRGSA